MRINLLMTGGGAPGAPGIIKCFKESSDIRLITCDANPNAVGKYLNDGFITVPKADDQKFIETILTVCRENMIGVVVPLVTRELFHFARHKQKFIDAGIKVLVSDNNALEVANNKSALYKHLFEAKISVPEFRVVNTIDEFISAINELGYPKKRVCFKPSVSNGSRGFRVIDDNVNDYDLLFNYKPNNTYIKYKDIISILSRGSFPELLVSEYLPGDEFSIDCLAEEGKCLIAIPRIRLRMNNGISVEGEFINERTIIQYCSDIIASIGLDGNIGIQVKQSIAGDFKILEINPRLQGTVVAALGAGVNLPLLAVKKAMGIEISPSEWKVKWGTKFSRYWEEVFY